MSDLRNVGNTDEKHEIDNDIQKNNDKKDNKEVGKTYSYYIEFLIRTWVN